MKKKEKLNLMRLLFVAVLTMMGMTTRAELVPETVHLITDKVQFNSNYDASNDWYGYQWYNRTVGADLSGRDEANLWLTMKIYLENLDNPGDVTVLSTAENAQVELATKVDGNTYVGTKAWAIKGLNLHAGWNTVELPFSTARNADPAMDFSEKVNWFRLFFARIKSRDAFRIRMTDVKIIDKSKMVEAPATGDAAYTETNYDVADLGVSSGAKTITKNQGFAFSKVITPAIDASKHNPKQLYLEVTADITEGTAGDISVLTQVAGQLEVTSSGKNDLNEATFGITTPDWKPGLHTYYLPFSTTGVTNGELDYSNINYFRMYAVNIPQTFEGSLTIDLKSVRIVDFTTKTTLPTFFSDGMLIQQKKPINIWGYATEGKQITVSFLKAGTQIETRTATTDATGKWQVTFSAQDASYTKYSMEVKEGSETIQTISDILIGELWVAGGQSNMAFVVGNTVDRDDVYANATNDNIRFLWMPNTPMGTESPYTPTKDIAGAYWGHGNNATQVSKVSAVAYSMVKTLQEKLGIPVGFLYTPLGGSVIEAWLTREAVESNATLKNQLDRLGLYYDKEFWVNGATTVTGLYNQKVGPLAGMGVAGVIWYQGESNSGHASLYATELDLLKSSWEKTFGFAEGTMPFVFTQVCPWKTELGKPQFLAELYENMYDAWKKNENNHMAMFSLYDQYLEYQIPGNPNGSDPIHPTNKTPVGKRFATSVYNMVYGNEGKEYTAPVPVSYDVQADKIVVTFSHVGEGLKTTTGVDRVHGFAIADESGVFANANAKITGTNTVEVWNPGVKSPKMVSYAFVTYNTGCNLANSEDLPAAPFRSDRSETNKLFNPQDWTYADAETIWGVSTDGAVTDMTAWQADGGTLTFDTTAKSEGKAALRLQYTGTTAKVGPVITHQTTVQQFANFGAVIADLHNPDNRTKSVRIEFSDGTNTYKTAAVELPRTTEFKTLTFDIKTLTDAAGTAVSDAATALAAATAMNFVVTDTEAGTVYVDNVLFGLSATTENPNDPTPGTYTNAKHVQFPNILGDNMVMQQQTNVKLWGTADNGATITVKPSWTTDTYTTTVASGKWEVSFPTVAAGGPYTIAVNDTILQNVMLGEVWYCSGQSNMEMPMEGWENQPVNGSADAINGALSNVPLRMFTVGKTSRGGYQDDCDGEWLQNTPEAVAKTSALAYYFARYLNQQLDNVPVGIIVSAWSGSNIAPWMSPEATAAVAEMTDKGNSFMFKNMTYPLLRFPIKGMLWYQGEANVSAPDLYSKQVQAFVSDLRTKWGVGQFPFYYVQLAPFPYSNTSKGWGPYFREMQEQLMELIPNSGMAVTTDAGSTGIHPADKETPATRLARWALNKTYGKTNVACQAPVYESFTAINTGKAEVAFNISNAELGSVGRYVSGFEMAGSDGVFQKASARVSDEAHVVLTSDQMCGVTPTAVRFMFSDYGVGTLRSADGIAVAPFRSDNAGDPSSTGAAKEPVAVILTAGQSNTSGRVPNTELPSYITTDSYANCKASIGFATTNTNGTFSQFWPKSDGGDKWAFDAVTYYNIAKELNKPFYVIKRASGGTAINPDAQSNGNVWWSADPTFLNANTASDAGGKSLLKSLLNDVEKCVSTTLDNVEGGYDIKCLLWHQGEGDYQYGSTYYANLKAVFEYIRTHLVTITGDSKYASLPIIMGTVSTHSTQYSAEVKAAQQQLASEDSNIYLIDMADATLLDSYHFDAANAELLGQKMFDIIKNNQLIKF